MIKNQENGPETANSEKSDMKTFFNDNLIGILKDNRVLTKTRYDLTINNGEILLITTIEQRIPKSLFIEEKQVEAPAMSLIDSLATQTVKRRRRCKKINDSPEEEPTVKPRRRTKKSVSEEDAKSLVEMLKNEEDFDLNKFSKRMSEGDASSGEKDTEELNSNSQGVNLYISEEETIQEHIDSLSKMFVKDPVGNVKDSEFFVGFTNENIQEKKGEYIFKLEELYRKHNKLKGDAKVDLLSILRDIYRHLWFSSAGTSHILFGRLDKAFVEAWQTYLMFLCDLGILVKGENIFYGYFRFRTASR